MDDVEVFLQSHWGLTIKPSSRQVRAPYGAEDTSVTDETKWHRDDYACFGSLSAARWFYRPLFQYHSYTMLKSLLRQLYFQAFIGDASGDEVDFTEESRPSYLKIQMDKMAFHCNSGTALGWYAKAYDRYYLGYSYGGR